MRQFFLTRGEKVLIELEFAAAVIDVNPAQQAMAIQLYIDGYVVGGEYPRDSSCVSQLPSGAPVSRNYFNVASTGLVSKVPFTPGICEQVKEFKLCASKDGRSFYKDVPGQEVSGKFMHTPCKAEEIPAFIARKTELAVRLAKACDEGLRELYSMAQEKVQEDNAQEEFYHSLLSTLAAIC